MVPKRFPHSEFWLRRQATYDLAQARKREHHIKVARYEARLVVSGREASGGGADHHY